MFQKDVLFALKDLNNVMTKTAVNMIKQFMDRNLAVQFVGAILRNNKTAYIMIDTALYSAMRGNLNL